MHIRSFAALAIAAATLSCGGGGSPTAPQVFTSLALTASAANGYQFGPSVTLTATPKDATGASITNLGAATYTADLSGLVTFSGNTVNVAAGATGTVQITASLTAQNKTLASPPVTLTLDVAPMTAAVVASANLTFGPAVAHIKAGGTITWSGLSTIHNVDFVNATPFTGAAKNGAIGSSDTAEGAFADAGTFLYHCDAHGSGTGGAHPTVSGMSGTIVVH